MIENLHHHPISCSISGTVMPCCWRRKRIIPAQRTGFHRGLRPTTHFVQTNHLGPGCTWRGRSPAAAAVRKERVPARRLAQSTISTTSSPGKKRDQRLTLRLPTHGTLRIPASRWRLTYGYAGPPTGSRSPTSRRNKRIFWREVRADSQRGSPDGATEHLVDPPPQLRRVEKIVRVKLLPST